jgi:hypothetical protein
MTVLEIMFSYLICFILNKTFTILFLNFFLVVVTLHLGIIRV